jgi:glyoxylase-like metal-dependent hydrolase (beta-lactamase superfamily II)
VVRPTLVDGDPYLSGETKDQMPDERWSESTECHRGILSLDGAVPALLYKPTIAVDPLGAHLWTATDGVYRTVFVEGERSVIAFDTFYSPGSAVAYRHALGRLLPDKRIETLIYSHDHLDHTGFGQDLAPEARVIAHEYAAKVIEARAADGQLPATQTWLGTHQELELDGRQITLLYPGPTHGNGNVAAFFPESKTLFMVDTLAAGVGYTFLPDWHIARYLGSLRPLLDLSWDRFVPGHFWVLDRAGVAEAIAWWESLAEAASEAYSLGVDPDNMADVVAFADAHLRPAWGHLFRYDEYAALNLMRFLLHHRTGSWGLEDSGDSV